MKKLFYLGLLLTLTSCFPTKTAPKINTYKLQKAKRFHSSLPKDVAFIFQDKKDEGAFYQFLQSKYNLDDEQMNDAIPFVVDDKTYFFNFYERDRTSEAFLLGAMLAVAIAGGDPSGGDYTLSGSQKWYIALLVFDEEEKDALNEEHPHRKRVVAYLDLLRREYYGLYSPIEQEFRTGN